MNKIVLFYIVSAVLICLLFLGSMIFVEKNKNIEIKKAVEIFLQDLNMSNHDNIEKKYPGFRKILKYRTVKSYEIKNIEPNGDGYTVYVSSNVMFKIKLINGDYIIQESKGLSGYLDSDVYDFLKKIGCISANFNDIQISQFCSENENYYKGIISGSKKHIQENLVFNSANLSQNNGSFISGNIILQNNSKFDIPANSYKVDFGFINTITSSSVDRQTVQGFMPEIPSNSSISIQIDYIPINGGNKFGPLFKMYENNAVNIGLNQTIINLGLDCEKWKSGVQ